MKDEEIKDHMTIGVVGAGFVGSATALLASDKINVLAYDIDKEKCVPPEIELVDLKKCDLIFICVPTPMAENGSCHTEIIEECLKNLARNGIEKENIIVRSTVPVGFCEAHQVHHMPEFLTEKNWRQDFKECPIRIFGVASFKAHGVGVLYHPTIHKVRNLFDLALDQGLVDSSKIEFCTCDLAETTKNVRNCFLAVKLSFFNEIESFCRASDINYSTLEKLVKYDGRIGETHTKVPGGDARRGFGGTCFPKDVASFICQFTEKGVESPIMSAAQYRNNKIDRPEKDWALDAGRAVI